MDIPVSCRLTAFLMLLMISATDQLQSIDLGSTLLAGDSNSRSWKSLHGDFAFGFQQVANERYLLAIVFEKLSNKTIVWSANRGNPVEKDSKAELSSTAGLVLTDPSGKQVWAASRTGAGVAYGAMLDTGNFVLVPNTNKSSFLWQSFDEPTDTLLPGQVLNRNGSLFSSFSESNYAIGRFKFMMQADANLVLYPLNYPKSDQVYSAYWATDTWSTNASSDSTGFQLVFNESGHIYLVARNGNTLYNFSSEAISANQLYMRLTLDPDGVLRQYLHPKASADGRSMEWSVAAFQPSNICLRVVGTRGGGACGHNNVCDLGTDQRPKCSCPKEYSLVDPTDRMSGCKPDFVRQGCQSSGNSTGGAGFVLYDNENMDWPYSEYDYFEQVDEEWCRQGCLGDCFCEAAVFRNNACWKMGSPLRNGRVDPSKGGKAMIKVPNK